MSFHVDIMPKTLHFKQPAGTSRGVYTERKVYYLRLTSRDFPFREGFGECSFLPDLSCDAIPDYESRLTELCQKARNGWMSDTAIWWKDWRDYPSMIMGMQTALWHFRSGSYQFFDTPFSRGEVGIPINGLIWMGSKEYMLEQIQEKLANGFHCIKLKIGGIDFESELALLHYIRERYPKEQVEIRVDANGAFTPKEALHKLERLAAFELHSIEQPISTGQLKEMAELCRNSPVPIALDEELIHHFTSTERTALVETLRPQFLVIKPSLHGGLSGTKEWIQAAQGIGAGWWITSALESNIGLNAIAQFTARLHPTIPQGLGTGGLYTNNLPSPLRLAGERLWFNPGKR